LKKVKRIALFIIVTCIAFFLMPIANATPELFDAEQNQQRTKEREIVRFEIDTSSLEAAFFKNSLLSGRNDISKNSSFTREIDVKPVIKDVYETDECYGRAKVFEFNEDTQFVMERYTFSVNSSERLHRQITIPGSTIEIRHIDTATGTWHRTSDPSKITRGTLYIDTDMANYIISVPSVYTSTIGAGSLEVNPSQEQKLKIEKGINEYTIDFSFPVNKAYIGEIWYLKSNDSLIDWNNSSQSSVMLQDLYSKSRFAWDGYYFPSPSNYVPYSKNMYYRIPANYAGASYTRYGSFAAAFYLGYAMTYTTMENQNSSGYIPTGPKSKWLEKDFGIGTDFFDTRFNTEFGENLILACKRYKNTMFNTALKKYCDYFVSHAKGNHYTTKNGGWLVQDYNSDQKHKSTHVSLNHQLSEIIFLYNVYLYNGETTYKDIADKMLLAIEDTKDEWIMQDNNLRYAMYYYANTNIMEDYPYLTYNDLKHLKEKYYEVYRKDLNVAQELMEHKLKWMKANGVTGYEK